MNTKRKLKFWGNVTLLVLAVCFLGLGVQMKFAPKSIDWVGSRIVKVYRSVHKHQMEDALDQIAEGNPTFSINLLHSWEDFKKGDRAYPFKRTVLVKLSEYLHGQGRFEELLELTVKWRGLDDRDITALAFYYEALRHSVDHRLEGEDGLRSLFYKFPANHTAVVFYAPLPFGELENLLD